MNKRLVTWLLIMPAICKIHFLLNQNFNKFLKFIAHENICAVWYIVLLILIINGFIVKGKYLMMMRAYSLIILGKLLLIFLNQIMYQFSWTKLILTLEQKLKKSVEALTSLNASLITVKQKIRSLH